MVEEWKKEIHTPKVGIAGVVFDKTDNRILLIRRKYPPRGIAFPGGFQETGKYSQVSEKSETISQTAKREVFEETGVVAIPKGIIRVNSLPRTDSRFHVLAIYVLMDPIPTSFSKEKYPVMAGDDAEDAFWAYLDTTSFEYEHEMSNTTISLLNYLRKGDINTIPLG